MKSIKNAVSVLERRRWSSDQYGRSSDDYYDYESSKEKNKKMYIVYYDEKRSGTNIPTTAAFTSKPFEKFEDAWKEAKIFVMKKYGQSIQDDPLVNKQIEQLNKEIAKLKSDNADPKRIMSKEAELSKIQKQSPKTSKYELKQFISSPEKSYILVRGVQPEVKGYEMKVYIKYSNYHSGYTEKSLGKLEYRVILLAKDRAPKVIKVFNDYEKAVKAMYNELYRELDISQTNEGIAKLGKAPFQESILSALRGVMIVFIEGFEIDPKYKDLAAKIKLPSPNRTLIDTTNKKMNPFSGGAFYD